MIRIIDNPKCGSGFDILHVFEEWSVNFITYAPQYGDPELIKRHTLTDEAFVLIRGGAELFTSEDGVSFEITRLEPERLYVVPRNTWHHIRVSEDALVIVVENSNTSMENTERKILSTQQRREITE